MNLLREPLIWFVVMALISLFITFVLFKSIKSSARIKRKDYLITGGIAGFLFVFFAGWYTFTPMLKVPIGELAPSAIPDGFRPYSEQAFAVALPQNFGLPKIERKVHFEDAQSNADFYASMVDNLPASGFPSFDPGQAFSEEWIRGFQKIMPAFKIVGAVQPAPHQGRRGYVLPIEVTVPDDPDFGAERGQRSKMLMHFILDDRSRRLLVFMYDDNETGKNIMSTLNLP